MPTLKKLGRMVTVLILIMSFIIPASISVSATSAEDAYYDLREVFQLLEAHHISGISAEQLSQEAIRAMIEALDDPHTVYYTAEQWQQYERSLGESYVGVGIKLQERDAGFQVIEVFDDSPAARVGIKIGDYIIGVNGQDVDELTLSELVDLIVGEEGTIVNLSLLRGEEELHVPATRAPVHVPSMSYDLFHGEEGALGYIKISSFASQTHNQFSRALDKLNEAQISGLIIDVRGNPGGYLQIVAQIAAHFIESGPLIYTENRHQVTDPYDIQGGQSVDYPLVVLIDEGSASASEILAAALQDYDLATLIGTKTYGKGSVQRVTPLSSGGYLKLTMERYLTPKHNQVDGVGVTPHVEVSGQLAQLLTALRWLGSHHIEVVVDLTIPHVKINGVHVDGLFDIIAADGQYYLHSRAAAALLGGVVVWHGKERQVELIVADQRSSFAVSSPEVKLIAGKSYIELDAIATSFASFTWFAADDIVTMNNDTVEQRDVEGMLNDD